MSTKNETKPPTASDPAVGSRDLLADCERCPPCGGCGEVLGWNPQVEETDWLVCSRCNGYGFIQANEKGQARRENPRA